LLASTVKAGTLVALGGTATAVLSAKVAALTEGVIKAMFLTKLKTMTTVVVALGVFALGVGALGLPATAQPQLPADSGPLSTPTDDQPPQKKDKAKRGTEEKKKGKIVSEEKRAKAEEAVAKLFNTKQVPRVVVETFNGAIEVTARPKGGVAAKVTKTVQASSEEAAKEDLKNVDVQMTQEGDTVRITAKSEGDHPTTNRAAAVELQVPPGAILELKTSNGNVAISAPTGDAKVRSSNGQIEVKGSKGNLDLKTSNGNIAADGAAGKLDLHTSNGAISVKSTRSSVTAHTS